MKHQQQRVYIRHIVSQFQAKSPQLRIISKDSLARVSTADRDQIVSIRQVQNEMSSGNETDISSSDDCRALRTTLGSQLIGLVSRLLRIRMVHMYLE